MAHGDQYMRRCFMTGKQCIFHAQRQLDRRAGARETLFVAMPYRANLNTFYTWSLRPYLEALLPRAIIRRADELRNTGYVMCENICRRIQEASCVVVDLSLPNPNVYYELGLAAGLGKPIIPICDGSVVDKITCWDSIGVKKAETKCYPNVGMLAHDAAPLMDVACTLELPPRRSPIKAISLVSDMSSPTPDNDIPVTYTQVVEAAYGVAIAQILDKTQKASEEVLKSDRYLASLWTAVSAVKVPKPELGGKTELESLQRCESIVLADTQQSTFERVANALAEAFVCIVDIGDEYPLSYFWLGYCHAREINVVPLFRSSVAAERHGTLAFDIRALWCLEYNEEKPELLAKSLGAVLEELIIKDVTTRQRHVFWQLLTQKGRIHIYTGAVHNTDLNREMVGDWDLRAVSELVRYLSSSGESVLPQLERPVYAWETIEHKLKKEGRTGNKSDYLKLVKDELANKNCLIVASADVNPMTEVVLAHAYYGGIFATNKELREEDVCFPKAEAGTNRSTDRLVKRKIIALKGAQRGAEADGTGGREGIRYFSRAWSWDQPEALDNRGFMIDHEDGIVCRPYKNQDQADSPFSVLAHLMVIRNPFSAEQPSNDLIVLLNGVSGPGTFGLAELLTGGEDDATARLPQKASASEQILATLNTSLKTMFTDRTCKGVEMIVEVKVQAEESSETAADQEAKSASVPATQYNGVQSSVKEKFYDKRNVVQWTRITREEMKDLNPRLLQL